MQTAIPVVIETDRVKLYSEPVMQNAIPDVLGTERVKLCSEPVMQNAIPAVIDAAHVKLCSEPVLYNHDQVVSETSKTSWFRIQLCSCPRILLLPNLLTGIDQNC